DVIGHEFVHFEFEHEFIDLADDVAEPLEFEFEFELVLLVASPDDAAADAPAGGLRSALRR
ncbi:MAG TPA: hypothetical protein PLA44_15190, partial [Propionibacteriaceae bacterium]|nr:hypothetical protein [Propionibacteriaceae bacterium]